MTEVAELVHGEDPQTKPRRRVPFLGLGPGACRFPLGRISDPPDRFCGEPAPAGSPYCPSCRRIAYVGTARRR